MTKQPSAITELGIVMEVTEPPSIDLLGKHYTIDKDKITFPHAHFTDQKCGGPHIRLDDRRPKGDDAGNILGGGLGVICEITDLQGKVLWRNWTLCRKCRSLETEKKGDNRLCRNCGEVFPQPPHVNPPPPD